MSNKITRIARQLLEIEENIQFRFNYKTDHRPYIDGFDMITFEQMWSDTTCGFGGIGDQAFTAENVYIFIPVECADQRCIVYIGSRFAYYADYNEAFKEDIRRHQIASVRNSSKYQEIKNETANNCT